MPLSCPYTSIDLLCQQTKPTHWIDGILEGKIGRLIEALETTGRVQVCFRTAATATRCSVVITRGSVGNKVVQNVQRSGLIMSNILGKELANVVRKNMGRSTE
ncbi:hypothetical protein EDC04DRAFT_1926391 [Pisolithus marmoratus]|nr:hypothetical protein EDC04DRAFT_1926391 [Pisolithus marmoratus]